jgi:hypothetical protein
MSRNQVLAGISDISGNGKCRNDARYYYGTGDRLTTPRRAVLLRHFRPERSSGICEQRPSLRIGTAACRHLTRHHHDSPHGLPD